jgi:hypothetical protein
MRNTAFLTMLFFACSPESSRETDFWPIQLARAPIVTGGLPLGGLLARTLIQGQEVPLVVDTAFPTTSFAKAICPQNNLSNWDYNGNLDVFDGVTSLPVRRASFRHVGLFNLCPGAVGDATIQPSAVLGGSLLYGFSVQFVLPREPTAAATMTLWPLAPTATDEWYADHGKVALSFSLRGAASVTRDQGDHRVTLPNTRVVLGACITPDDFSPLESQTSCPAGMALQKASGIDALLVVSTGTGPLVLGEGVFSRIAVRLGMAADAGQPGELYVPLSASPVPARFVNLPRLALLTSNNHDSWLGACAELGRARRIEWVLTHQETGACFERCDASGGQAVQSSSYLELGGEILTAVISETSDLFRALNIDAPNHARVDGIIGAGTLAGTQVEIDYLSTPQGRFIASCAAESNRAQCLATPSCPGLSEPGQTHRCFGLTDRGYAPVCD